MSANKRRVYISDHGTFNLFGMNISLPGIIELSEEQIEYINASGLYKISELNAAQSVKATPTTLSIVDGDRFDTARTISVNELSFKAPIMGTQYAKKAKNAIIVKKNSIYAKAAMAQALKDKQAVEEEPVTNTNNNSNNDQILYNDHNVNNNTFTTNNDQSIQDIDNIEDKQISKKKKNNNSSD